MVDTVEGDIKMRIMNLINRNEFGKSNNSKLITKSSLSSLFVDELTQQQAEDDSYATDIDTLRNEIDLAGNKVSKEPTLQNFKLFRELLSKLMKRISTEAYKLEKYGGTPQHPRYFEVISIINKEADQLYNLIIFQQKENMSITAKVIGIKGLVVDLLT